MHCSANIGPKGDTALFFGLSGTGKTTLSADPERGLIGDDEHGWGDHGVFNFEGGCYAKVIKLSPTAEPEIYATTKRFSTVLENVVIDPATRSLLLDLDTITENTRAAYPIDYIANAVDSRRGQTSQECDVPDGRCVWRAAADQQTDARRRRCITSSAATRPSWRARNAASPNRRRPSAPALARRSCRCIPRCMPRCWAKNWRSIRAQVWLVNTGWSGGPYGVGERMKIAYTRAMVHAALNGDLDEVPTELDPIFGLPMPIACPACRMKCSIRATPGRTRTRTIGKRANWRRCS